MPLMSTPMPYPLFFFFPWPSSSSSGLSLNLILYIIHKVKFFIKSMKLHDALAFYLFIYFNLFTFYLTCSEPQSFLHSSYLFSIEFSSWEYLGKKLISCFSFDLETNKNGLKAKDGFFIIYYLFFYFF